jgi:hypothetical protein
LTPRPEEDTPGVRRAWGWVAHLLDGGTTPWRDWTGEGRPGGRVLPGAQQLELLRRLNQVGPPSAALATRVLEASAPGRGRPDLELAGAVDRLAFGPPPVDPADLPDDELLRVATSVLADDVVAAGVPDSARVATRRPWARRYRVVGDSMLADPVRAELVARGRPPGGRGSVILVLGTDVGQMLVHAWTARSLAEGGPGWRDWLDPMTRHRTLPPRIDLVRAARAWSDRVGPERVRIVLDPAEIQRLVGVRRPLPRPPELSADAVDLARRVGQVLGLLAVPDRRRALLHETLLPRLVAVGGPPLVVPEEHTEWVHARGVRVRDALLRAGYPVHGDPDSLLPVRRTGVSEPSDAGVLALALRLVLEEGTS